MTLKDRIVLVTGASRGIGKAIAVLAGRDGAKVVLAAKTVEEHPVLPGTLQSAAAEVEEAGGQALAIRCDLRNHDDIQRTIGQAVARWGRIDILVNNASAISLAGVKDLTLKKFDLMNQINYRGTYLMTSQCLRHMPDKTSHILNLSPPPSFRTKWFAHHTPYSIAKYSMSMCVLGLAEELRPRSIAINALWPYTAISTAALRAIPGFAEDLRRTRTSEFVAKAAYVLLNQPTSYTGNFCIDEKVLRDQGMTSDQIDRYRTQPPGARVDKESTQEWALDLFVEKDAGVNGSGMEQSCPKRVLGPDQFLPLVL